jgi:hypothetical protein
VAPSVWNERNRGRRAWLAGNIGVVLGVMLGFTSWTAPFSAESLVVLLELGKNTAPFVGAIFLVTGGLSHLLRPRSTAPSQAADTHTGEP